MDELAVLKTVADRLEKANINYMLTGSMALNYYAMPRMTRDIDFVVEIHKASVPRLQSLFEMDFYFDAGMAEEAIAANHMFNLIHNESLIKIDFVIRKNEPYRAMEFSRRRQVDYDGFKLWVVSAEDLILSKLHWAKESFSDVQLRDVSTILKGFTPIDHNYLNHWISELGLQQAYSKVEK